MGRELGIHRIDFFEDGTAVIRSSDYNLCGRTDFTQKIANLFYSPEEQVDFLIMTAEDFEPGKVLSAHVKVEDDYWCEKEFDMEYAFVKQKVIQEICNECIDEDEKELAREEALIEDARMARQKALTLNIFKDFSEFIDEIQDHYDGYNTEALGYLNEIDRVERKVRTLGVVESLSFGIVKSYVLLTYSE